MEIYDSYDYQDAPAPDTSAPSWEAGFDGGAGISPDTASMVMESLGVAGIDLDKWSWEGQAVQTGPNADDISRAERASSPVAQDSGSGTGIAGMASKFGSFLTGAGDLMNKYKTPLEMLGRGLQTAAKAKNDAKAAQVLSDSRIKELQEADRLKQGAAARYSDSVKGLRAPGLINQGKLQRVDGNNVFNANGVINRG